jgi:hypothetical protein
MCRWLAAEQQTFWARIRVQIQAEGWGRSGMGNPKAQARFAARLRKEFGRRLVRFDIITGKRGRYGISNAYWTLVRPDDGREIDAGHPIPELPWLCCRMMEFWPKDPEKDRDLRLVTLTHHAMQRLAERCEARTHEDLLEALVELATWRLGAVNPDRSVTHRVAVAGGRGVAIVEAVDKHDWLVKTVLPARAVE